MRVYTTNNYNLILQRIRLFSLHLLQNMHLEEHDTLQTRSHFTTLYQLLPLCGVTGMAGVVIVNNESTEVFKGVFETKF
jgi:hypothetical protein